MELRELKESNKSCIFRVYSVLKRLEFEYPGFKQWFFAKVVPGIAEGTRRIFVVLDGDTIVATLILKDSDEKKICTLRVSEKYRNKGIGAQLLVLACHELRTAFPLVTVPESHISDFARLFQKYHFSLQKVYPDYYTQNSIEYCFNGVLNEDEGNNHCCA
jgi:hypothetical protein